MVIFLLCYLSPSEPSSSLRMHDNLQDLPLAAPYERMAILKKHKNASIQVNFLPILMHFYHLFILQYRPYLSRIQIHFSSYMLQFRQ